MCHEKIDNSPPNLDRKKKTSDKVNEICIPVLSFVYTLGIVHSLQRTKKRHKKSFV